MMKYYRVHGNLKYKYDSDTEEPFNDAGVREVWWMVAGIDA